MVPGLELADGAKKGANGHLSLGVDLMDLGEGQGVRECVETESKTRLG